MAKTELFRLIYFSQASREVGPDPTRALLDILATAKSYNGQHKITGALLYCDGWFVQALEGARDPIEALFEQICSDPRNTKATQVAADQADNRLFASWSMCAAQLGPNDSAITSLLAAGPFRPDKIPVPKLINLLRAVVAVKHSDGDLLT